MADTSFQLVIEEWIRTEWLPKAFGQPFSARRLRLSSGGLFAFDAVSEDGEIVATISTSAAKTAGGKRSTGAVMKLRSDMLFLLMSRAPKPVLVFTEPCMHGYWHAERSRGRVPPEIDFVHVPLPAELAAPLAAARARSSTEMLAPGS